MRSFILIIMVAALASLAPSQRGQAQPLAPALMPATIHKPLMVIRFNQRKVFYQKPLYRALAAAVEAAPAVRFNLISYVPRPADPAYAERALAIANAHLREVVSEMRKMGVPPSQINLTSQLDAQLKHDEVHIYVQ